jgi:hypothetical protein
MRASVILAFGIGAAAIDKDWDGLVHFKNWKGGIPNRSQRQLFTGRVER